MTYAYQVVRWPFDVPATNLTLRRVAAATTTTITIAAGTYICDGSGSVIAPKDLVQELETRVNAGIIALGGTATVAFDLTVAGHFRWTTTLGDTDRYTIAPTADLLAWTGATSANYSSGELLVCGGNTAQTDTYTYQMLGQWHPGVDADYDSGDLQRQIVSEGRNLKGRVRRVVRSYAPWDERRLDWSRIAGGRMSTARAATAAFAAVAGIATGEDNTWENMWRYLTGEAGPYADNRVYVYSTNDPATAVRSGPYDVVLTDSEPGLAGLPAGGYVQGMASEHYAARLLLVEAS